jgi:hypothetical protein
MLPPRATTGSLATVLTRSELPCVESASIANPDTVTAELTTPATNLNPVKAGNEVAKPIPIQQNPMPASPTIATLLRPHLSATLPQKIPPALPRKYAHCSTLRKNDTSMSTHPVAEGTRTMICVDSEEDMIASARKSR